MAVIQISSILEKDKEAKQLVLSSCEYDLSGENTNSILDAILEAIPQLERFSQPDGLEHWVLEINQTEDEGIEFLIVHDQLDLLAFIMEDDDSYEVDDILENSSIDSFQLADYGEFLNQPKMMDLLIKELGYWEIDSEFHPYAVQHLKKIFEKGFDLPVFGGDKSTKIELSWDVEELFIGGVDDDSIAGNPDYNLAHEHFDADNPDESIDLGLQAWTDFAEEDDDWEADIDEDDEFEDEFDDDWDVEADEEWDPGFEEEESED